MASVLDLVRHYQHSIEKYPQDEQKVLKYIDRLYQLDVKVQHLQDTGVGRTVNALRKEPGNVGLAARSLVSKWKMMVAAEESDQEEDQNDSIHNRLNYSNGPEDNINQSRSRQYEKEQYEKSNSTPRSEQNDRKQNNGDYSGSKRKHRSSEEEEPETKKSKHSSSSEREDFKRKIKSEPPSESDSSDDSQSDESDSDMSELSEDDKGIRKIKIESPDKFEPPVKESSSSHRQSGDKTGDKKESGSIKSHESADRHSKHSSESRHSEKSSSKDKHHTSHKDKSSKEKDSHSEKKHKSGYKSSDKEKNDKETKSTGKHNPDKHKSSSHKTENSSEKQKSHSDKSKSEKRSSSSSLKSEKEKHKSGSEKQLSNDKHKSKDSNSSRSKDKSSSGKDKSKERSSSSKDKSSSHKSDDKKHSSSNDKSKGSDSKNKVEKGTSSTEKKSSHKSSSSSTQKSKSSSSKLKEDIPKKITAINGEDSDADGIDCGSGASFADVLGMIIPSKPKKKSTPIKDGYSPNNDLSPATMLAPSAKLAPLPVLEISALPEISPNYKPRPPPKFLPHFSEEDAINAGISSKNQRTKVYSGNKVLGKIPSLYEMCVQILQEHIDALEYTGGVPYEILKPVVDKATPQQLFMLEHHNPYLMEDTDHLWRKHCEKHFRNKRREEMETWREMYLRCQEEQEDRLKSLTANIRLTQEAKKAPIKQTKMAYVDTIVKPPRNIARKQALHGTAHSASASPAARVASLARAPNVLKGGAVRPSPAAPVSAATFIKPKKAPLMQKALQFMRGRKR